MTGGICRSPGLFPKAQGDGLASPVASATVAQIRQGQSVLEPAAEGPKECMELSSVGVAFKLYGELSPSSRNCYAPSSRSPSWST